MSYEVLGLVETFGWDQLDSASLFIMCCLVDIWIGLPGQADTMKIMYDVWT